MPYRLSAVLKAHSSDVKGVASPSNDLVISASRDQSAICWTRSSPSDFNLTSTRRADGGYIYAVAVIPAGSPIAPDGYILTAHHDTLIRVWSLDPSLTEPVNILHGHTHVVSAIAFEPGGTIISGSWDSTARVWRNFQPAFTLSGHSGSVLAVHALGPDEYLTGSADRTVKLWQGKQCIRTFSGHTDAVRGLTILTDIGFASCSNDGDILWWTHDGDIISKFSGHGSYVYGLAALPSGDLVSCGEDRSVRVWRDGELAQAITHPAVSVWSVAIMPNGDIVSGASDGVVRIFTESEERLASAEDQKAFEDQVAAYSVPAQTVDNLPLADSASLNIPGTKPGETKFVKKGSAIEVYQWDSVKGTWQQTGYVTDKPGSGSKTTYEGKDYDYVFDVDIQDGVPPLKLPFNVSENPFTAAQRFLERNELPMSYLDQVVDFINKNTGNVTLGSSGQEYQDPFTGATRYQPAPSSAPSAGSTYQDPFTGGSRYQPTSSAPQSQPAASSFSDPFTGAGRYTPGGVSPSPAPLPPPSAQPFVPMLDKIAYTVIQNPAGLLNLLRDNNTTFNLAMTQTEQNHVEQIVSGDLSAISSSHVKITIHLLETWPPDAMLPVVDLARILAGRAPQVIQSSGQIIPFFEAVVRAVSLPQLLERPRDIWTTLALRALANIAHITEGEWASQLLRLLSEIPYSNLSNPQRVIFAGIISNYSIVLQTNPTDPATRSVYLQLLATIIGTETDPEALYRVIVALGNTVHATKARNEALDVAGRETLKTAVSAAIDRLPVQRPERKVVARKVLHLLSD